MFNCIKGNKYIYDTDIGWNTRKRIIEYRNNYKKYQSTDKNGYNDWMLFSLNNNHHNIKPNKRKNEFNPLYHSRTILIKQ